MTEVRCTCRTAPLLGVAEVDECGNPFLHVKAHKQSRLISEVVMTSGTAHIRCRSCNRWHRVTIREGTLVRRQHPLPNEISLY